MNEPNRESTPTESASLLQRLFSRRQWPKYLFAVALLATLVVLLLALENRRGIQAQPNVAGAGLAVTERAAAEKLIPPPVPDEQNFAATPFFQSLFDKSVSPGASQWPDDFSRADQWPRRIPTLAESAEGRKTGRFVWDLLAWKTAFEKSQDVLRPSDTRDEIAVTDQPDPATNAQAAIFVLEALKPYDPALAELRAASKRPYARFNVNYTLENPWGMLLPQLAVVKRTVQLLRLKASAELAAGHSEQALHDILLMLRLVNASKDEPTLISQLVRVACLEITFQPIWEGLAGRRWSEQQLQTLQAALEQFDFITDLKLALSSEKVWVNVTIGLVRDKRTPGYLLSLLESEGKAEPWQKEADRVLVKAPRDWFDQEQRNYNQLFDERLLSGFDVATRRVHPRVVDENVHLLEKALRNRDAAVKEHLVFATAFLAALSRVHLKLAGTQGYADLATVACALERHRLAEGKYPETLAVLTPRFLKQVPHDIVTGQPLHYQFTDDSQFLLYSVGWNETDDNGELAFLASGRGPEKKDGDWVWRYPMAKQAARFE
jgi:hypothetical protein